MLDLSMKPKNDRKQQQSKEQEEEETHDPQNPFMFWVCIISGTLLAANTITDIFIDEGQTVSTISYILSTFILISLFVNSCLLCKSKAILLKTYFLLDKSFLAWLIVIAARNTLMYVSFDYLNSLYITLLVVYSFNLFVYLGNFRVMMIFCKWSKWKVISAKVSLIINAIIYIFLGTYVLVNQLQQISELFNSTYASSLKDLIFFYVFGMFTFVYELYNKITDQDGTSTFQFYYSFTKQTQKKTDQKKISNSKPPKENQQQVVSSTHIKKDD